MEENKYVVDGFLFSTKEEFDRAKAEKETVTYLVTTMDMTNAKALLRLYNKSIQKKTFQTVFGYEFLENVRKKILASGIISEKMLSPIPIKRQQPIVKREPASNGKSEKYKRMYEDAIAGKKIKNIVIAFLVIILVSFFVVIYRTQYSVFTYFTNYKTKMKNEVINEYEDWQKTLEQREQKVKEQEEKLKQAE